jgi:hypothetical protein
MTLLLVRAVIKNASVIGDDALVNPAELLYYYGVTSHFAPSYTSDARKFIKVLEFISKL